MISVSEPSPSASAAKLVVPMCSAIACMRVKNSLGFSGIFSPKKSLICVEAISSAMPLVNPITMGRGMKRTAAPSPVNPRNNRITPAIMVTMNSPERPCFARIAATITTNAPVGPPI